MSSGWVAAVVAALGLNGVALGAVMRLTARWTRVETQLAEHREDLRELSARITWLERQPRGRHRADD